MFDELAEIGDPEHLSDREEQLSDDLRDVVIDAIEDGVEPASAADACGAQEIHLQIVMSIAEKEDESVLTLLTGEDEDVADTEGGD